MLTAIAQSMTVQVQLAVAVRLVACTAEAHDGSTVSGMCRQQTARLLGYKTSRACWSTGQCREGQADKRQHNSPGKSSHPAGRGFLLADGCCHMRHAGLTCSGATRARLLQQELCGEAAGERAALADLVAKGPVPKQELDSGCAWAAEGCLCHSHCPASTAMATCRQTSTSHQGTGPVSSLQEASLPRWPQQPPLPGKLLKPRKLLFMRSLLQHSCNID